MTKSHKRAIKAKQMSMCVRHIFAAHHSLWHFQKNNKVCYLFRQEQKLNALEWLTGVAAFSKEMPM
jgi:hypothetical protein